MHKKQIGHDGLVEKFHYSSNEEAVKKRLVYGWNALRMTGFSKPAWRVTGVNIFKDHYPTALMENLPQTVQYKNDYEAFERQFWETAVNILRDEKDKLQRVEKRFTQGYNPESRKDELIRFLTDWYLYKAWDQLAAPSGNLELQRQVIEGRYRQFVEIGRSYGIDAARELKNITQKQQLREHITAKHPVFPILDKHLSVEALVELLKKSPQDRRKELRTHINESTQFLRDAIVLLDEPIRLPKSKVWGPWQPVLQLTSILLRPNKVLPSSWADLCAEIITKRIEVKTSERLRQIAVAVGLATAVFEGLVGGIFGLALVEGISAWLTAADFVRDIATEIVALVEAKQASKKFSSVNEAEQLQIISDIVDIQAYDPTYLVTALIVATVFTLARTQTSASRLSKYIAKFEVGVPPASRPERASLTSKSNRGIAEEAGSKPGVGSSSREEAIRVRHEMMAEAVRKNMAIKKWKTGGGNAPVKVVAIDKAARIAQTGFVRGYITTENAIKGKTPREMERTLGFTTGYLGDGAGIIGLKEIPAPDQFKLVKGYTNVPGSPGFPSGEGVPQWELEKELPIGSVRLIQGGDTPFIPANAKEFRVPPAQALETMPRLKEMPTKGNAGNRAESVKQTLDRGVGGERGPGPAVPLTEQQKALLQELLDEMMPGPLPPLEVTAAAVRGGLRIDIARSGVILIGGGRRKFSVYSGKFGRQALGSKLVEKASQKGVTEVYLYISKECAGANKTELIKIITTGEGRLAPLRRAHPDLEGKFFKFFGPSGDVWWSGIFLGPR